MKKFCSIVVLAILFASCSLTYNFVQVCRIQPIVGSQNIEKGEYGSIYKDANCEIQYLFWSNAGNAGFIFNNISNEMLYLDLTKTFYIANGFAFNYSSGMHMHITTSTSSEKGTTNTSGYTENVSVKGGTQNANKTNISTFDGYTKSNTSQVQEFEHSMASEESEVIAIPPHSKKLIQAYSLTSTIFVDCDLERFPKDSASIKVTQDESPLTFSNYITYHTNNGKDVVVNNEFYISEVVNYAEPTAFKYILRDTLCQNMTNATEKKYVYQYSVKVYDREFNIDKHDAFYNYYNIQSNRILYKQHAPYYNYNYLYDGYTTNDGSGGWIGSSNTTNDRTIGTVGFHTY